MLCVTCVRKANTQKPSLSGIVFWVHIVIKVAAVAQWIEYWPPKPRVVGSIPASRTIQDTRKPLCFLAVTPIALVGVFVSGRFLVAEGSVLVLLVPESGSQKTWNITLLRSR